MTDQPNTEGFGTDITAEAVVENPTNAAIPATSNTTTDSPVASDAGNAVTASNSTTGDTVSDALTLSHDVEREAHPFVKELWEKFGGAFDDVHTWIEQEWGKI